MSEVNHNNEIQVNNSFGYIVTVLFCNLMNKLSKYFND